MRRAEIETSHASPDRAERIAAAVAPDNTAEMTTRVEGERVVTTIERDSTSGLQSTVDDYVVNLDVARRTVDAATASGKFQTQSADLSRFAGETVTVETLRDSGIAVVGPEGASVTTGKVRTEGWIRPQLRDGGPSLPVEQDGDHYLPANLSERGGG